MNDQELKDNYGITATFEFVPWSKSRNYKKDTNTSQKNLNWKVRIFKHERLITETDYMQGIAHCPSYKQGQRWNQAYDQEIGDCVERGTYNPNWEKYEVRVFSRKPISAPKSTDVLYCLLTDASVLDYGSFEDWAWDLGYDPDSRSAETIYRQCLAIALQLRNGLGEMVLARLRDAFRDY